MCISLTTGKRKKLGVRRGARETLEKRKEKREDLTETQRANEFIEQKGKARERRSKLHLLRPHHESRSRRDKLRDM